MTDSPYTFAEATELVNKARVAQAQAEDFTREASVSLAEKERAYRMALAKRILELHQEGIAWTVAQDVARGDRHVAQLRMERDIAEGVKDAAEQAGWRHAADRRALQALLEWSAKRDLAEDPGQPAWGTRRAAA